MIGYYEQMLVTIGTQLNRLGNELLVILSILEITNMHLQFSLLSLYNFFEGTLFSYQKM